MPPAPSKRVHDEDVLEKSSSKRAKTSDTDSTLSSIDSDGEDTDDPVAINVDSDESNVDSNEAATMPTTNAREKGQSKRTKQRDALIATVGRPVVRKGERVRERVHDRQDKVERAANQKIQDKGRPRSGQPRNVSKTRERIRYPEEFEILLETAILKWFQKNPADDKGVRSTCWDNLKKLFGLILEREWEKFPADQQDGLNSNGDVKWRRAQFKMIGLKRYLKEHSKKKNHVVLKEEFHHLVSGANADVDSHGKLLDVIREEIADDVCSTETEYPDP